MGFGYFSNEAVHPEQAKSPTDAAGVAAIRGSAGGDFRVQESSQVLIPEIAQEELAAADRLKNLHIPRINGSQWSIGAAFGELF